MNQPLLSKMKMMEEGVVIHLWPVWKRRMSENQIWIFFKNLLILPTGGLNANLQTKVKLIEKVAARDYCLPAWI